MQTPQIRLSGYSNTSSPPSVKKDIDTSEFTTHGTVLSFPQKIIEGKSLLNINEREPLINSKNGILYYLLDRKY